MIPSLRILLLYSFVVFAWLATEPAARAQANGIVTGTVLRPNGTPLAGADIDFYFTNGNEQKNVSGDFTNASGVFITTIPQGTYTLVVKPAGTELILQKSAGPFSIGAFLNVGTIQTQTGAGVQGTLKNTNLIPLGNSDIVLEDAATGAEVVVPGMGTAPLTGAFQFVVPPGTYNIFYDTTGDGTLGAPGQTLNQGLPGGVWTQLGTILRPPGQVLSAEVRRQSDNLPVANCDIDVRDPLTLDKLYTPGDDTNTLGFVDVVVPAGTWTVDVTPAFAELLVSKRLPSVAVPASTNLGTILLQAGVVASGLVVNSSGAAVSNCDVDVYRYPSGSFVLTTGDNTNAAGHYQIVVPPDNLTMVFTPVAAPALAVQTHVPTPVFSNITINSILPAAGHPVDSHYGSGLAGTGGLVPQISTIGVPVVGNPWYAFRVDQALPGATTAVFIAEGTGNYPFPEFNIIFWIDIFSMFSLDGGADALGVGIFPVAVPTDPLLASRPFYSQAFVIDAGAGNLLSHSDGLILTVTG